MENHELTDIAATLVTPGKGILAADESVGTMDKRLAAENIDVGEESRRQFRELVLSTAGLSQYISGVILFDETMRQHTADGVPLHSLAMTNGVLPGIKVDTGAKPLAGAPGEKITEGLDGLRDRLTEYYEMGARFAKWRAVIQIGQSLPSDVCVHTNAHALGRYAALCQEAGLVPIVEPEVLADGDHSLDRSAEVTAWVLQTLFDELRIQRVSLDGIVLKPNMVTPGLEAENQVTPEEVAIATLDTLFA
ncbi:MAG: class I fructose-bisphosphate aldolase, partial [Sciscionella sp.]